MFIRLSCLSACWHWSDIHINLKINLKKYMKNYKNLKNEKNKKIKRKNLFSMFVRPLASHDTNFLIIQNTKKI